MSWPRNPASTTLLADTPQSALFCFSTGSAEPRARRRAPLSPKHRQKAKKVRERGACLRCRLLKISCSEEDPCASCMRLALANSTALERKVLRWSDCIRTLLTDVKFFDEAIPSGISQHSINALEGVLAATPVTLEFASQMTWDIDSFSNDILTWLNTHEVSSTSKVGAMSSPQFQDLIKPLVGHEITTSFRLMIYSISLAHTQRSSNHEHELSLSDLQKIGAVAGKRCLKFLDNALTASSLAKILKDRNSKKILQALFLLVFGTILAVGYAQPVTDSPVFPLDEGNTAEVEFSQIKTLHRVMQTHLCRTLAHHMVYLGTRLDLPISSTMERFILDEAESIWNKEGSFIWKTAHLQHDADGEDEELDNPYNGYDYLTLDVDKWPVYLTEAYYASGGYGPQEPAPSSDNTGREFPVNNLPVIEDISLLAHLNYDEDFNTPFLEEWLGSHSTTEQPPLPLNVPGPFHVSGYAGLPPVIDYATCKMFVGAEDQHLLQWSSELILNWLLV